MANRGQTSPFIKNFKSKRRAIINNLSSNSASNSNNLNNHQQNQGTANASKKPKLDLHPKTKYKRNLADLSSDELEIIAKYLDSNSCLNLLRACKSIYLKLNRSSGFWKHLCFNENFHEYTALR